MKRRGFALWEIVAVICVVLIIAVVAYPFFAARGHRPNHRSMCQSNLKQIGLGFRMYTQDYDEKYPLVVVNENANTNSVYGWADALQFYLKSTHLYQCDREAASHSPTSPANPTQQEYTDYWFNRNLAGLETKAVENVVMTIVSGDGNDGNDDTTARYNLSSLPAAWRTDKNSPAYRHLDGANYAFADGHVKWYKPEDISEATIKEGKPTFALK